MTAVLITIAVLAVIFIALLCIGVREYIKQSKEKQG